MSGINRVIKVMPTVILMPILIFLGLAVSMRHYVACYYPTHDDVPLLVNSTGLFGEISPLSWLTKGYSQYFSVFTEWTRPFSEFMRPLANLTYYLNARVFSENYGYYLYTNYALISLLGTIVFLFCRIALQVSWKRSCLAALVMVFATCRDDMLLQSPAFAFDALAAVLIGVAFLFLFTEKIAPTCLLLTLALFTKETAIFAPPAAGLSYYLIRRLKSCAFGKRQIVNVFLQILVPLGVWLGARWIFFGGIGGTYPTMMLSPLRLLFNVFVGLATWPLGITRDVTPVIKSLLSLKIPDVLTDMTLIGMAANLLINLGMIIAILARIIFSSFPRPSHIETVESGGNVKSLEVLLSINRGIEFLPPLAGIWLLLLILGMPYRFGIALYLFGLPLLFSAAFPDINRLPVRLLSFLLVLVISLDGAGSIIKNSTAWRDQQQLRQQLRQLAALTAEIDRPGQTIYIFDTITGTAGVDSLKRFFRLRSDLIIISGHSAYDETRSVENEAGNFNFRLEKDGSERGRVIVKRSLPAYAEFIFFGSYPPIFILDRQGVIRRNNRLLYRFNDFKQFGVGRFSGAPKYHLGHQMELTITNLRDAAFIFFDFSEGEYVMQMPHNTS